ncbi:MAG: hypothetical protein R3E39_12785 [Anaerolineae bacterium]
MTLTTPGMSRQVSGECGTTALEVMESTLGAAHYKIMATTSTQQALEVARRPASLAIIADVLMPDKLGWECCGS